MRSLRCPRGAMTRLATVLLLTTTAGLFTASDAENVDPSLRVEEACVGLGAERTRTVPWTYSDCVEIWGSFVSTFGKICERKSQALDIWRGTSEGLRREGSPCLLAGSPPNDGIGSTTIRILYAWIFAEEMGCEWVTPDWGEHHVGGGNGEVTYCHPLVPKDVRKKLSSTQVNALVRCAVVDLLQFFNFGVVSVDVPENVTIKTVEVDTVTKTMPLAQVRDEIWTKGSMGVPWDRVLIKLGLSVPTANLAALGSWDIHRNRAIHKVLQKARDGFNQSPRPWYDEEPICDFDPTRLNFAVHVRMGDRRAGSEDELVYFKRLEEFMATVTDVVVQQGLQPPLFRIFTETTLPCPDPETGLFEEFPLWPVELYQVQACYDAEAPEDCFEKKQGLGICIPERDGIFYIKDKPMVLHLNPDIRNALSCMIKADGIVMGCSTFGQIAGILSQGISFFSMECAGDMTGIKSRMTPGLAVAEKGYRWVPIRGSWLDPVLYSTDILRLAVEELTMNGRSSW